MGEQGVTLALEIIHKELDVSMAFCGHTKIEQRRSQHPAAGDLSRLSGPEGRAGALPEHPSLRRAQWGIAHVAYPHVG